MTHHIEKAVAAGIEPIVEKLFEVEQRIENIKLLPGPPGKDAEPGAVAQYLVEHFLDVIKGEPGKNAELDLLMFAEKIKSDPAFCEKLKGVAGKDADPELVAQILVEKHLEKIKGAAGKDAAFDAVLVAAEYKNDKNFVELCRGPAGKDAPPVNPADVANILVTEHLDKIKGKDGKDGETPDIELDVDALEASLKKDKQFCGSLKGEKGDKGEQGEPGRVGVGVTSEIYKPGVHRAGTVVQANLGQYFIAEKDTAQNTDGDDWRRIGNGGLRWCGVKNAAREYRDGDLYIDNGSTFLFFNGKGRMLCRAGRTGEKGEQGAPGKDAPFVVAVTLNDKELNLVFNDGSVQSAQFEGLTDVVSATAKSAAEAALNAHKAILWIDQVAEQELTGVPVRVYRGIYKRNKSYLRGDLVNYQRALYLFDKDAPANQHEKKMIRLAGSASGGSTSNGGGGGDAGYAGESALVTPSDDYAFTLNGADVATLSNADGLTVYGNTNIQTGNKIEIGADNNLTTITQGAAKRIRIIYPHFNSDTEPYCSLIGATSNGGNNSVYIGGGNSDYIFATRIQLWVGPDNTYYPDETPGVFATVQVEYTQTTFRTSNVDRFRLSDAGAHVLNGNLISGGLITEDALIPQTITVKVGDTTQTGSSQVGSDLLLRAGGGYRAGGPPTTGAGGSAILEGGTNVAGRGGNAIVRGGGGTGSGGAMVLGFSPGVKTDGTNQSGGNVDITGGKGSDTNHTTAVGASGGILQIKGGNGGNATSGAGNGGVGGNVVLAGGNGGSSAGGAVGAHGKVLIEGAFNLNSPPVPATATSTGQAGDIAWNSDFFYVCVAANTWKRAALSTW